MALEFGDAATCQRIIGRCIDRGLLTDWFLFAPHCLRLAPPLTIGEAEIREACDIILSACAEEAAASEAQAEAAEEAEAFVAHVGQRAGGGPPDEVEPEEA